MNWRKNEGDELRTMTRRHFFEKGGFGIGALALTTLLNNKLFAANQSAEPASPLSPRPSHFPAKAKNIIYLFMAGAPSQLDLFDHKPKLKQFNGDRIPEEFIKGERFAFIKGVPRLLGSPYEFKRFGQSGAEVSSLFPHLSTVVDEIAIVRSIHTEQFNHAPGQIFMNCGSRIIGRPEHGFVAHIRAWKLQQRPTRLRRSGVG